MASDNALLVFQLLTPRTGLHSSNQSGQLQSVRTVQLQSNTQHLLPSPTLMTWYIVTADGLCHPVPRHLSSSAPVLNSSSMPQPNAAVRASLLSTEALQGSMHPPAALNGSSSTPGQRENVPVIPDPVCHGRFHAQATATPKMQATPAPHIHAVECPSATKRSQPLFRLIPAVELPLGRPSVCHCCA